MIMIMMLPFYNYKLKILIFTDLNVTIIYIKMKGYNNKIRQLSYITFRHVNKNIKYTLIKR
jgi:hypothetical protein